jgi:hypothetical protein
MIQVVAYKVVDKIQLKHLYLVYHIGSKYTRLVITLGEIETRLKMRRRNTGQFEELKTKNKRVISVV